MSVVWDITTERHRFVLPQKIKDMLLRYRFKEGKELYQGRKYEMLFWDNKASLVVKDSMPNDSSKYRCEVSSPLGHVESTGSLTVYSTLNLS